MYYQRSLLLAGLLAALALGTTLIASRAAIAEQPGMPVQFCSSNPDQLSIAVAYLSTQNDAYNVQNEWTTIGWTVLPASDLGAERCAMVTLPLEASKYAYYVAVNNTQSYFPNQRTNSRYCVNTSLENFKIARASSVDCSNAPGLGYEYFSEPRSVGQVNLITVR